MTFGLIGLGADQAIYQSQPEPPTSPVVYGNGPSGVMTPNVPPDGVSVVVTSDPIYPPILPPPAPTVPTTSSTGAVGSIGLMPLAILAGIGLVLWMAHK